MKKIKYEVVYEVYDKRLKRMRGYHNIVFDTMKEAKDYVEGLELYYQGKLCKVTGRILDDSSLRIVKQIKIN